MEVGSPVTLLVDPGKPGHGDRRSSWSTLFHQHRFPGFLSRADPGPGRRGDRPGDLRSGRGSGDAPRKPWTITHDGGNSPVTVHAQTDISFDPGAAPISFNGFTLAGESSSNPTTLQFGPDDRLYVGQQNGLIKVYDVDRDRQCRDDFLCRHRHRNHHAGAGHPQPQRRRHRRAGRDHPPGHRADGDRDRRPIRSCM